MTQGDPPPTQGVGGVSDRAAATAATLLEAYDAQDRRQEHIKTGNYETARRQAERARSRMAKTWVTEYPHVGERHAETAGRLFMDALFLQDEIENWAEMPASEEDIATVLVTTSGGQEAKPAATDERWTDVESLLDGAAVEVGIPGPFAAKQAQFWLRHGQRTEGWEEAAAAAFDLRLQAMLPGVDAAAREPLVATFVEGVKLHDGWSLDEGTADRSQSRDLVGRFYQRVFDLGEVDRTQ